MRLGVDTGGTFTDFVWLTADGRWQIHKQRSTPRDPSVAILAGIDALAVPPQAAIVHGTTVATNALLERRGARTALVATAGFGDVLAIGRQNRPDIYALVPHKPAPLVPAALRFELAERVTADRRVLLAPTPAALAALAAAVAAAEVESVAVALLFSFLHPQHEQAVRDALRVALGETLPISLSSDVLPEYREYERTATTVINAYVAPLMMRYLARLAAGVAPRRLSVMQSSGGLIGADVAGAQAARTALSGPAGGVVGAFYVAQQAGLDQIITFDMGGTSTDVALCPGRIPLARDAAIAGLPLRLPAIDIHTVGAGGGSIAFVDAGGALRVGPHSAGADPGPACYPRTDSAPADLLPTVTDANLVLGRLDADHFLGGTLTLDVAAATAVIGQIAAQTGNASPAVAAWDIVRVANANMERAIRTISVERGYDPRDCTLLPFGGAGPLHACDLADSLEIPRVLIPPVPGVLSALGMLVAAPTRDYAQTLIRRVQADETLAAPWLADAFAPLAARARAEMAAEMPAAEADPALHYALEMRYLGQSHELTVWPAAQDATPLATLLHQAHARRYGYSQPAAPVELVTLRLTATLPHTPPALPRQPTTDADPATALVGQKPVYFGGAWLPTALYDRARLQHGQQISGPAIVFQYDTTVVLPPGWHGAVDATGNLLLRRARLI